MQCHHCQALWWVDNLMLLLLSCMGKQQTCMGYAALSNYWLTTRLIHVDPICEIRPRVAMCHTLSADCGTMSTREYPEVVGTNGTVCMWTCVSSTPGAVSGTQSRTNDLNWVWKFYNLVGTTEQCQAWAFVTLTRYNSSTTGKKRHNSDNEGHLQWTAPLDSWMCYKRVKQVRTARDMKVIEPEVTQCQEHSLQHQGHSLQH